VISVKPAKTKFHIRHTAIQDNNATETYNLQEYLHTTSIHGHCCWNP